MKVFFDSIGCRLNQAEIEEYARQFRAAGHSLAQSLDDAELVVINTCAVTAAAAADSRQKIRQAARSGQPQIVLTGCWSTLKPQEAAAFPGVSLVVKNIEKDELVQKALGLPDCEFELEPVERQPLSGPRMRTRAFIKAQDGCNNQCAYCITTIARGTSRSRPIRQILSDIQAAHHAQEIVLTGVHLGSWGNDFSERQTLYHLVAEILDHTTVPRIRLSSLEPWDVDERFFELWKNPRLCRQLHLPLQSGSPTTLRRMARKITPAAYAELVAEARRAIPGVAITTDLITGFPGEDEAEFEESLEFVRGMQFADGHVFPYSERPGTSASRMPNQVPRVQRKERSARMRAVIEESAQAYRAGYLNQVLPVLWENADPLEPGAWSLSGLTSNYLRVYATASRPLWNQITPVRLVQLTQSGFYGQITLDEPAISSRDSFI